jgi:UDP-N-acetylmuramate--alanine ligase
VAGIHGKTTTTSLVALLLDEAGLSPSYIIGAANVPVLGSNAHFGDSEYFVMEADEYRKSPTSADSKFLDLNPQIAIISSIELDHPDFFSSVEDVYNAFYRFSCRVPRNGSVIIDIDYPKAKKLVLSLADRKFETYGFSEDADWKIVDFASEDETKFSLLHNNVKIGPFTLKMPGRHNALNAAATIIVAHLLKIDLEITKRVISEFKGVQRRFEKIAEGDGITIIDDYAHHPTAIESTLEAVRAHYPHDKIWCVFQPHTFSRTQALIKEFGKAFKYADKIIITDIYASAREKEGTISSADLVNEIKKNRDNVYYFDSFQKIEKYFKDFAKRPLVVITVGAGDIYKLAKSFSEIIKERQNGKK